MSQKPLAKPLAKFMTKSGREIEIWPPQIEKTALLLEFVNRLTREDTFLSFTGKPKTFAEEENWIKNAILNMKAGRSFIIWAIIDGNKIVGQADVNRGGTRDFHVGKIGLMVDKDFRQDGIGRFLLEYILEQAKKMGIKIAVLDSFGDNKIAINLYKKFGFKEYARLPRGYFCKRRYSDAVKMYKEL